MSGKNILIVAVVLGLIIVGGYGIFSENETKLGGGFGPQISGFSVVNSSSSITTGTVLWTNASSSGDWFRIANESDARVWCALDSSTSTVRSQGGVFLSPVTSSTGSNVWEAFGARGAVSCASDGGTAKISWSYTTIYR